MTKEDRLNDIKDYVNYLDGLYKHLHIPSDINIIVLGFSQGVATACRYLEQSSLMPDTFIMWASVFPPDLLFDVSAKKLKNTKLFLVY